MKSIFISSILFFCIIFAFDQNSTYLVLNHFDQPIKDITQSLINNFNNSSFIFDSTYRTLLDNLDEDENPASKHMELIKKLGETHKVNYVLLNRIEHKNNRLLMDGLLFNTRSGGLIHRRKINLRNYNDASVNEINLWVGSTMKQVEELWEKERESILYLDPEDIQQEKTPMGAALRSLAIPGWGQAYSNNYLSAGIWAGIEVSLSLAFLISYNNYDSAAKSYLENLKLYDATDDEKEVSSYRNAAEKNWDEHVLYSQLAIALASTTVSGWISNSIHAWIFGPRPYSNIYQKGISNSNSKKG